MLLRRASCEYNATRTWPNMLSTKRPMPECNSVSSPGSQQLRSHIVRRTQPIVVDFLLPGRLNTVISTPGISALGMITLNETPGEDILEALLMRQVYASSQSSPVPHMFSLRPTACRGGEFETTPGVIRKHPHRLTSCLNQDRRRCEVSPNQHNYALDLPLQSSLLFHTEALRLISRRRESPQSPLLN